MFVFVSVVGMGRLTCTRTSGRAGGARRLQLFAAGFELKFARFQLKPTCFELFLLFFCRRLFVTGAGGLLGGRLASGTW